MTAYSMPTLQELGPDLLKVNRFGAFLALSFPFVLTFGFFIFALEGWWLAALLCPVVLSFYTYASISHDLVHRNLGLPRWLNEVLLCAIELLTLRAGHAYRASHLHHHAHFPSHDDLEGAAAAMPWWRALLDGPTLQVRIWLHAVKSSRRDRAWIWGEGAAVLLILAGSLAALPWTCLPAFFCGLNLAGSWVYPIATSWIPHDAHGATELTQTRLFRGRVIGFLALEHLYHLEHHLYPQVPHFQWPELARRLDPYLERAGIKAHRLWF
ncbi:MAG: fatty acid desaturase [Candidatus Methylacidiphilales bacterium]|nr:fatty acid desaturase [Candidatus Methylacidiphilales bacterium]